MQTAPDFNRTPGYPSKGKLIGPAWQAVWDSLADGQWHTAAELAEVARPWIVYDTTTNLLRQARKHRLVEVDYTGSMKHSSYRLASG
jgi:hypothetical protein